MPVSPLPTATHYYFRTNSLYDPNFTGVTPVGHQPMGFDEMMNIYQIFQVYQCDCIVTIMYNFATHVPADRFTIGCRFTRNNLGGSNIGTSMIEYGGSRYVEMNPDEGRAKQIRMKIKPWKRVPNSNFKSENNQGTAIANPLSPSFLDIWKYNPAPTQNANACTIRVQLDYTTMFSAPVDTVQS